MKTRDLISTSPLFLHRRWLDKKNRMYGCTVPLPYILPVNEHRAYAIRPVVTSYVTTSGQETERVWIDLLRFLAGCRTRRRNQALSVFSLSLGLFWVCFVLFVETCFVLRCMCSVSWLFLLGFQYQCKWLGSAPKWPTMCWWWRWC